MNDSQNVNEKPTRKIKIVIVNIILVTCILAAIVWGLSTYFNLDNSLYTNDAQVEEYITPVNVRIPGYIKKVKLEEHQRVKKGDTLVIIDDREYKIQLEQTEAAYLTALATKNV